MAVIFLKINPLLQNFIFIGNVFSAKERKRQKCFWGKSFLKCLFYFSLSLSLSLCLGFQDLFLFLNILLLSLTLFNYLSVYVSLLLYLLSLSLSLKLVYLSFCLYLFLCFFLSDTILCVSLSLFSSVWPCFIFTSKAWNFLTTYT